MSFEQILPGPFRDLLRGLDGREDRFGQLRGILVLDGGAVEFEVGDLPRIVTVTLIDLSRDVTSISVWFTSSSTRLARLRNILRMP